MQSDARGFVRRCVFLHRDGDLRRSTMRGIAAMTIGLALAGCAAQHDTLWPGRDWHTTALPSSPVAAATDEPDAASPADPSGTRVPRNRTRRGSGTPPDLLFE